MIPTNTLFEIIKSLSKAEKRSFKLQASAQGDVDNKNTVQLFTYIEKQKTYDEQKLKQHFKNKTFTKQLTSSKYYLYHQILKSLKRLHESKTPEGLILSILQYVPILNQKKLYLQSLSLLKRAREISSKNELFVLLFETLSLEEKTLYFLKNNQLSTKHLEQLYNDKQHAIVQIQNQSIYQNFRLKLFTIIKAERFYKNSKDYSELKKNLLKAIQNNPPSTHLSVYNMHYSLGLMYFYEKQFLKSFLEYKNLLIYIDKHPILKNDLYKTNYLNAAQNCIVSATYIPVYDSFIINLINKLEHEYKSNTEYTLLILRLKLALYIGASRYSEGALAVDKTKNIPLLISKAEHYIFVDIVFCCAQLYLWTKEYKKSIKWLNKLLKFEQIIFPKYIYIISLLMELLIHIELKNYRLLNSLCNSYTRLLKKEKGNYSLEKAIVSTIQKHNKHEDIDNHKMLYRDISTVLTQLKDDESSKNLILYFNLEKWIKSL